jgi:quercetin dioxygenase-like cupin family protein
LRKTIGVVFALCLSGASAGLNGQQPLFSRTILQQAPISAPGREVVTAVAQFLPGGVVDPHTHPGEEVGYVLEGSVVLERAGQAPVTLHAGEAFLIPAGTVHGARHTGSGNARLLVNYVVETGKPLVTPAPARP